MDKNSFLIWEQASRDTIDFKKIYVDVADDLIGGLLLSQIVYWNLPNQEGKTKLRVKIDGDLWLAKGREDWWEEIRITAKQFDRASKILLEKGIIEKKLKKFDGLATIHLKLNFDVLVKKLDEVLNPHPQNNNTEEMAILQDSLGFDQRVKGDLTKGKKGNYPKVKTGIDQRVKPLTENTTKTTTENTNISSSKEINNNIDTTNAKTQEEEEDVIRLVIAKCKQCNLKLSKKQIDLLLAAYSYTQVLKAITLTTTATAEIKNAYAYLLKVLSDIETTKIVNNTIVNTKESKSKDIKFNNFEPRDYDYYKLEKQLLGWDE